MLTSPEPSRKFKENKTQGSQGFTGKQTSNRKGTMTEAYAGHQKHRVDKATWGS